MGVAPKMICFYRLLTPSRLGLSTLNNPTTIIRFTLPQQSVVKLEVYDILGQRVAELVNKELTAGTHEVLFNASNLASGVYFYVLNVKDNFLDVKKMILLK